MKKGIVISSADWGVYLGTAMGMGFWSKLDPAGQDVACTFESIEQAKEIIASWDSKPPEDTQFTLVQTKHEFHATIPECVKAGLDAWNPMDDCEVNNQSIH